METDKIKEVVLMNFNEIFGKNKTYDIISD